MSAADGPTRPPGPGDDRPRWSAPGRRKRRVGPGIVAGGVAVAALAAGAVVILAAGGDGDRSGGGRLASIASDDGVDPDGLGDDATDGPLEPDQTDGDQAGGAGDGDQADQSDGDRAGGAGDGDQAGEAGPANPGQAVDPDDDRAPADSPTTTALGRTGGTVDQDDDEVSPDAIESGDGGGPVVDDGAPAVDPDEATATPTIPPPTTGTCEIRSTTLDGRSGAVEPGGGGACDAVGLTIEGVNPRHDLSAVRWATGLVLCQRHPAAEGIGVEAVTAAGPVIDLGPGLSRSDDQAAADPIEALRIVFDDRDRPITGPSPIATCRTATAELSIVHRPTS